MRYPQNMQSRGPGAAVLDDVISFVFIGIHIPRASSRDIRWEFANSSSYERIERDVMSIWNLDNSHAQVKSKVISTL